MGTGSKFPRINQDRLWSDLTELAKTGARPGKGISRPALSPADMEAKSWLEAKMLQAGLEVRTDAAFNQIGCLPGKEGSKVLALGSHLDTVPNGGAFDGALGVLAALECARVIAEQSISLPWSLEVINFCDEEGAHHRGTVGSRAMLGLLAQDEIMESKEGQPSFAQSLSGQGFSPGAIGRARRDPVGIAGFLELHIEQGVFLQDQGACVGAVTGIAGIHRFLVTVSGQAGHAGATPMDRRRDALVEAAPFFTLLPDWVKEYGADLVGTIGQVSLEPGVANVIPGECRFTVELRSLNSAVLDALERRLVAYAGERRGWSLRKVYQKNPVSLPQSMISLVQKAARDEGLNCPTLPSWAGHDCQTFALCGVPAALIFVPCLDGVSHSPKESITPGQAGRGCQVLLNAVLNRAAG
jgi:hydantoinase/carbamoylase family amidase